jgi:hypothetical protein
MAKGATPTTAEKEIHEKAMAILADHLWPVRDENSKIVQYTQGQHNMITQGFMMLMSISAGLLKDVEALQRRLESIERKGLESPLQYRGVWKAGTYPAGTFITHGGSVFHTDKTTDRKPGEGDWTLAVKRGADAK